MNPLAKTRLILLYFAAALCGETGKACDLCDLPAPKDFESLSGWYLGFSEQFTHFGTVRVEGKKEANPAGQSLDSSITQVFAGYQFNRRLGLQLNMPWIYRSFRRPAGSSIEQGTESGPGDLSLLANLRIITVRGKDVDLSWNIQGGVKFPTGDSSRIQEELNETTPPPGSPASGIHGHDLALGTGSLDGIVGSSLYARWHQMFTTVNVQYALRTRGDFGYTYANDLTWSVAPGVYLWRAKRGKLGFQLSLSGETKGKDRFRGENAEDTALTAVYLGPKFTFQWRRSLSLDLGAEIPWIMENSALQVVPDYRTRAAMTWKF